MSHEREGDRLHSRHNFVICCVLGVVTGTVLIFRAVQMHRFRLLTEIARTVNMQAAA
jgi:hypothetical protein